MDKEVVAQIEQITGHKFSDHRLLEKAFIHSSAVDSRLMSNERLEFLGDAILATVICRILFEQFPDYLEGDLTKLKSMLVSRDTCTQVAKKLKLPDFLKVGKGMTGNDALKNSLAACLLEALIAAIYLDGGFTPAEDFISRIFSSLIDTADANQPHGNFKSLLQKYAQQKFNRTPVYRLLDEKGPDHNKCFEVEAAIANRHFPGAWGNTKKQAEQKAAFNALAELGLLKKTSSKQHQPDNRQSM